ncbi:MAG: TRAP transporter small permease [Cloacibacillus porcorum]|uniref:TRAP transporter small permease n=1 Tax=Cloacibacillus porcorum TaxID=1197717 RepID=UPI0023F09184|nr:TRAP transporter small permease [Cloacibacillus porcorum]MCD7877405.1 TRAP transporter small permease [Cloacibacillus porcorum]
MKVLKWIIRYLEEIVLGLLLTIITCSIMSQVVMRYIFNASLPWPEEVSRYAMVMMCFMSICFCIKYHSALKIDSIVMFLPIKMQALVTVVCNILFMVLLAYLFYGGYQVTSDAFENTNLTPALGIKLGNIYTVALLSILLAIFRLLQVICTEIYELVTGTVKSHEKTIEDVI